MIELQFIYTNGLSPLTKYIIFTHLNSSDQADCLKVFHNLLVAAALFNYPKCVIHFHGPEHKEMFDGVKSNRLEGHRIKLDIHVLDIAYS